MTAQMRTRTRELPLLDPQLGRQLGIVAAHLIDEALRILPADEDFKRVTEREVARERAIDDCVDDHGRDPGANLGSSSMAF